MNDNLIEDYRSVITNTILSNETIVSVLGNDEYNLETADELLWKHLIPQQYVPDTITDTGSYIMYDIDENVLYGRNSTNAIYTELTLYFWLFAHKNMPKYKGSLRNDILSRELKLMFEDKGGLGIAKNHLVYNKVYNGGNNEYMGRLMAFKITDWANDVRLRYVKN